MLSDSTQFYSPGRLKSLLWRYDDLVQLCRGVASPEVSTQHLPRETPEGGFEAGAAIKADLDAALRLLEPVVRRVIWDYYVAGYAAVEIAAMVPGCNRWFVDRARHRGIRQMALSLNWVPKAQPEVELSDDPGLSAAALKERMSMIVHRSFSICPKFGPKGYTCPVIDCRSYFDREDGHHVGQAFLEDRDDAA